MTLGPINVAAITPKAEFTYHADPGATLELVDYLCAAGVNGIALLGSTGEFPHFGIEDRARLLDLAARRSRVPVLAGVTHSTLDGTVTLAQRAAGSGAAAVLVMPPYFFPYEQSEVREFYLRFSDRIAGAIPVFLYNIPFYTTALSIDTSLGLLETGRFAGIKDSSGSFEDFQRLRTLRESTPFTLLIGNDRIYTRARTAAADGVVSGVACAVPELLLGIEKAIQNNNLKKTHQLDARLQEFIAWLDRFPSPLAVVEATAVRGLKIGPRSIPLSAEKQKNLEEFRGWFGSWLEVVRRECE